MLKIDFKLDPSWNKKTNSFDLTSADEGTLRYQLVLGDIVFEANECDFSAKWGWVPILDFAAALRSIVEKLAVGDYAESVFEFTESEATLFFKRSKGSVLISASYVHCQASVPFDEFALAVSDFVHLVFEILSAQYPTLQRNLAFRQLITLI